MWSGWAAQRTVSSSDTIPAGLPEVMMAGFRRACLIFAGVMAAEKCHFLYVSGVGRWRKSEGG
jgi:hypothetical protein